MTTEEEYWNRLLTAVSKVASKTEEFGDARSALGLWTNALQAAVNAGDADQALRLYEKVSEQYAQVQNPEPWMSTVISAVTGRLMNLARQRGDAADMSHVDDNA